jgi:hypothetical protein
MCIAGMCAQKAVEYLKTQSQQRSGGTEDDYDVPQLALPTSELIFVPETSPVRGWSTNYSPAMFGLTWTLEDKNVTELQ